MIDVTFAINPHDPEPEPELLLELDSELLELLKLPLAAGLL